jgi:hypothetical protein
LKRQFGLWFSGNRYHAFIGVVDAGLIRPMGLVEQLTDKLQTAWLSDLKNRIDEHNGCFYVLEGTRLDQETGSEQEQVEFLRRVGERLFI